MNEVGTRLLQAVRFQRDAFVWMDFNDRATGDALILVAVTRLLIQIGLGASIFGVFGRGALNVLEGFLFAMLGALIFWLLYSGVTWAAAKFLLQGEGSYALVLRIVGFAYPTFLLLLFTIRIVDNGLLAFLLGSLWFLAVVGQGMRYAADLPIEKGIAAAVMGMVGYVIVASILRTGF